MYYIADSGLTVSLPVDHNSFRAFILKSISWNIFQKKKYYKIK